MRARRGYAAICYGKYILLTGGTSGSTLYSDVWCLDIQSNRYSKLPAFRFPRTHHTLLCTKEGILYVVGGSADPNVFTEVPLCERLDLHKVDQGWKTCAAMQRDRSQCGCALGTDGSIYVFGSSIGHIDRMGNVDETDNKSTERYDPQTDAWTMIPSVPEAICQCACISSDSGQIYLLGNSVHSKSRACYSLDVKSLTYSRIADLPCENELNNAVFIQ